MLAMNVKELSETTERVGLEVAQAINAVADALSRIAAALERQGAPNA